MSNTAPENADSKGEFVLVTPVDSDQPFLVTPEEAEDLEAQERIRRMTPDNETLKRWTSRSVIPDGLGDAPE